MTGKVINGHFVDKEVVIDVKFRNDGALRMMLIDSRVPKSVVSREWIGWYLKDMKVDESEIERKSCCRRFRMSKHIWVK